jgi:hypothetical protein
MINHQSLGHVGRNPESHWVCSSHWHTRTSIWFNVHENMMINYRKYIDDQLSMINHQLSNCGWKKSCITLYGWNPIINGINHFSTGAGFRNHPQKVYSPWPIVVYIGVQGRPIDRCLMLFTYHVPQILVKHVPHLARILACVSMLKTRMAFKQTTLTIFQFRVPRWFYRKLPLRKLT